MARKLRPAVKNQEYRVFWALGKLKDARDMLKAADCPQALRKVRRAIKSTEGAYRHIQRRVAV